jgi:hypothetical protein
MFCVVRCQMNRKQAVNPKRKKFQIEQCLGTTKTCFDETFSFGGFSLLVESLHEEFSSSAE